MLPDQKVKCPYTGFKMKCFDGVTKHNCPKWVHIAGTHPQTGEQLDRFACADSWIPLLLVENSGMQKQTGAAVESFRNEMVRLSGRSLEPSPHLSLGRN